MPVFDPSSLIFLQIRLEYDLDSQDRLVVRPGSDEQARCVVYQYAGGGRLFYRHDLPQSVQETLQGFDPRLAFADPARVDALLRLPAPDPRPLYQAAVFTRSPAVEEYPLVESQGDAFFIRTAGLEVLPGSPEVDPQQPAAIAWGVRADSFAAEVAVETQPAFQRRGYARQVVAAWAAAQFRLGRAAFYSHKASNLPSLALRCSLGAQPFADSLAWE